jgi:hypothetical protein
VACFKVLSQHFPGGNEEIHETISQVSQFPDRNLNLGPPEYEAEVPSTRPWRRTYVINLPSSDTSNCTSNNCNHCGVLLLIAWSYVHFYGLSWLLENTISRCGNGVAKYGGITQTALVHYRQASAGTFWNRPPEHYGQSEVLNWISSDEMETHNLPVQFIAYIIPYLHAKALVMIYSSFIRNPTCIFLGVFMSHIVNTFKTIRRSLLLTTRRLVCFTKPSLAIYRNMHIISPWQNRKLNLCTIFWSLLNCLREKPC